MVNEANSRMNDSIVLSEMLNILPYYVFWKDLDLAFRGCNALFLKQFNYKDPKEIIGKTDFDFPWSEELREKYRKDDLYVISTGKSLLNFSEEQVQGNGSIKTLLVNKVPLRSNNNEIIGILGTYTDITYLKKIENDLRLAKEKAEKLSQAKTEFLANISHDIKSPLVGVISTASLIESDASASPKLRGYASVIASSGKQISNFFTNCLDLSKLEMGEAVSKTVNFSLKKLVNDINDLFYPHALSKGLSLVIEYDESLPLYVQACKDNLYRILLNLMGNALKFTEKGHVILRVSKEAVFDDGQVNVLFEIEDTGIGIPDDKYELIFEKLHRLESSYRSQVEGSGIGLYMVDQYLKNMGGHISLKSKLGLGTTFFVTLSLKQVHAPDRDSSPPLSMDLNAFIPQSKQAIDLSILNSKESSSSLDLDKRILLVEDTPVVQMITKILLNEAGFHVDIANTGEEAVDLFKPDTYGLIYMDIGLPNISGYEATKMIREKESSLGAKKITPIIALTGHGMVDIEEFCGHVGMQAVLSKPLSREQAELTWKYFQEGQAIDVPDLIFIS